MSSAKRRVTRTIGISFDAARSRKRRAPERVPRRASARCTDARAGVDQVRAPARANIFPSARTARRALGNETAVRL